MYNYLLLYAIRQLKGQRSSASIYHILTGRRSAQTIQDAHFYHLTQFYGVYHQLKRVAFDETVIDLVKSKFIQLTEEEHPILTEKGELYIHDYGKQYSTDSFKGMEYINKSTDFSERLFLTIQTYSNLSMDNRVFQPVSDRRDVQEWFKRYYRDHLSIKGWLREVYKHINTLLNEINDQQARLFVDRLSGYQKYGLSIQQLALKYQLSIHDVYLFLTLTYHQLMHFIDINSIHLLTGFFRDEQRTDQFITHSAQKTHQLISKGQSLEQIMRIRRLKRSTIEDHIVELAYAIPGFDLSPYITQTELNDILPKIKRIDDHRLAKIKTMLDDQYSYFQIRLALVKVKLTKH